MIARMPRIVLKALSIIGAAGHKHGATAPGQARHGMSQDIEGGMHDAHFPPMRIVGSDEAGRSVAQQAYEKAMRAGVAETRQQGGDPDYDLLAQVASDIAQEAYDAFSGR